MIDKDFSLFLSFFFLEAKQTIKIQKLLLIEITRQTIKMLMCSCHKLIIHTLLKIAQHDISKSRQAERALYIIISRGFGAG